MSQKFVDQAKWRPKILLIAEAANPEWVSVPLIGWSISQALKSVADVHLVTQVRNRDALLRAGLIEYQDFTALDSEAVAGPLWKIGEVLRMGQGNGWTTMQAVAALAYPYFEHLAWKAFASRLKAGEFDVVHRVTPLTPSISSPLAKKCAKIGVPFVLGPINGGVPWPKQFSSERRREKEFLSHIRNVYKILPGHKQMLRHVSAIMVGSRITFNDVSANFRSKCIYLPENAIDPKKFSLKSGEKSGPVRACFIGRIVPLKGVDMLLEASADLIKQGKLHLDIIGDGPTLPSLRELSEALEITDGVTFHGWMEHEAIQEIASSSAIFAFPSIREFGGGAVLEAMALGLAPIVVDYAGPAELVTGETGLKVPLGSRQQIIAGFRASLTSLVENPEKARMLGENSRARVQSYFTWEQKAEQMLRVYSWVCENGEKPDLIPKATAW